MPGLPFTVAISDVLPVLARIKPQSVTAAGTAQTDVVDMSKVARVAFFLNLGDYAGGNDGSVAAGIYGDTAPGGSFTTLITGKSITPGLFTGSLLDDAEAILEVRADELATQGFRYCRLKVTPTNQNMILSAVGLGAVAGYEPGVDFDLAAVKQIINN